jgi:hypothetical protein
MRTLVPWALILLMPATVLGADVHAGVVYGTGSVFVNGSQLPNSMPVLPGDIIETKEPSVARIDIIGSTTNIGPNAIVRFRDVGIALDRGAILVATGNSLSVFARDFRITPTSATWTQFEVIRSGGMIQITARKSSVTISCGVGVPTLIKEGQQITRADAQNCGLGAKGASGAPTAAKGPILASPWAQGAGAAAAGSVLVWTLSHSDEPVSPFKP